MRSTGIVVNPEEAEALLYDLVQKIWGSEPPFSYLVVGAEDQERDPHKVVEARIRAYQEEGRQRRDG